MKGFTLNSDMTKNLIVHINKNYTYTEMADRTSLSRRTFSQIRNDRVKVIKKETIKRILKLQDELKLSDFQWYDRADLIKMGIEKKGAGTPAKYRVVKGIHYKKCSGIAHPNGPEWVPTSNFTKIRSGRLKGRFRSQCSKCGTLKRGCEPRVPVDRYLMMIEEMVNRVGVEETRRLIGISQAGLWQIRNKRTKSLRRPTARGIVTELAKLRANNVVRHRKSIQHGAKERGRPERNPSRPKDFYNVIYDRDIEMREMLKKDPKRVKGIAEQRLNGSAMLV